MPISSINDEKYFPTPVAEQGYRRDAIPTSAASSQPIYFEKKSITTRDRHGTNSKTVATTKKWTTRKKVIVACIIIAIIIAIVVAAILLGLFLSGTINGTTTTTTTTTVATTQTTSVITAYWTFDAVTNDYYGVYNGSLMNSASYFSTTSSQPFLAYGRGLSLTAGSSQYFLVSSPFLNLFYRSFTIELWTYATLSTNGDFGIFTQCQCSTCNNQCLYFIIRNYRLYISFTGNDLSGNTTLTTNTWYHIAFVYNYDTKQQILYINGVQDTLKSSASAYQGTNGTIWIGASQVYLLATYYTGLIDNFKITTRAKTSTELLYAATLTAYYSFDLPNPTYDSGPNGFNGTSSSSVVIISGRVNQGLRFTGSSSYFQAYGFFQMGYAVYTTKPFSIALWISPSAAISCAIVQISPYLSASNCHNLIGLFTYLSITTQVIIQGYAWPVLYGSMATLNSWTHVAVTYTLSSGLSLYVNGVYMGYTGGFSFGSSGAISYLQLGYYTWCSSNYISNTAYQGSVDEVYVYSREITQSEVTALANP